MAILLALLSTRVPLFSVDVVGFMIGFIEQLVCDSIGADLIYLNLLITSKHLESLKIYKDPNCTTISKQNC